MRQKQTYQEILEALNIPKDLAAKCSEILVNDSHEARNEENQEIINKTFEYIIPFKKKSICNK